MPAVYLSRTAIPLPYTYFCPRCGTHSGVRSRIAFKNRRCRHCGSRITTEEIDRQNPLPSGLRGILHRLFQTVAGLVSLAVLIVCGSAILYVVAGRGDKQKAHAADPKSEGEPSRPAAPPAAQKPPAPNQK